MLTSATTTGSAAGGGVQTASTAQPSGVDLRLVSAWASRKTAWARLRTPLLLLGVPFVEELRHSGAECSTAAPEIAALGGSASGGPRLGAGVALDQSAPAGSNGRMERVLALTPPADMRRLDDWADELLPSNSAKPEQDGTLGPGDKLITIQADGQAPQQLNGAQLERTEPSICIRWVDESVVAGPSLLPSMRWEVTVRSGFLWQYNRVYRHLGVPQPDSGRGGNADDGSTGAEGASGSGTGLPSGQRALMEPTGLRLSYAASEGKHLRKRNQRRLISSLPHRLLDCFATAFVQHAC